VTLARPKQNTLPSLGTKCGRRERESRRGAEEAILPRPRVVTEEGIPVFRKAALFAGRRRNEDLGRLVSVVAASSAVIARAGDSGCPKVAEEGNAVGLRNSRRRRRTQARDTVACVSGRVLRSVLRPVLVNPHYAPSGNTAVVRHAFRHRGWENLHPQEEPTPGSWGGRSAARRASLLERAAWCVRKGRWSRPSSPRGRESPGLVARTSIVQLQKSLGGV
jgi:hypothetical protein